MEQTVTRLQLGKDRWDSFAQASDQAWLWHTYDWQDVFSTWQWQDMSFAICDADDLLAVVPLHLIRSTLFRVIDYNQLNSFGSPALKNGLGRKQLAKLKPFIADHLVNLAQQHGAVQIDVTLPAMTPAYRGDNCPRINPLLDYGWDNTLTQTWVIDLRQGADAIWANFETRARTAIRKAEKSGVKVRRADRENDLAIYYDLHRETYLRTGVRPHPLDYFRAIWQNFWQHDNALILFAELDGKVVSAENFALYKQSALYWTGAASSQGLSVEANSLLQWSAMQLMIQRGIEWYETGEAFPQARSGKSKGLNDFKKSFGGTLYPYYRGRQTIRTRLYNAVQLYTSLRG